MGHAKHNAGVNSNSGGLLSAALIIVALMVVYANSLKAPFIFDDRPAITENHSIQQLLPLGRVLSPPIEAGSVAGRPLINLSFALNHALGGFDPRGYHLVNLLIHSLVALVLLGIVRRTLLQPALRERFVAHALPLATACSLLWSIHPLLTESVTCVVQRTELLGGLFYLTTLYCGIRSSELSAWNRWSTATVISIFLGAATKEIIATVPLVLFAYDYLFVAGSWREAWQRRWRLYAALASSWVFLGWLVLGSAQRGGMAGFGLGVSSWEYLLTQCRAISIYLRLSFWPHPLILDYGTDIERSLLAVLPQALLLITLAVLTVVALWRRLAIGFAGVWFFMILGPSSSVIPLISQTIAEHRMYLPLAALIVPTVLVIYSWAERRSVWLFAAAAIVLGGLTVQRNADYQSEISIWTDTAAKRPSNPRAHTHLAHALEVNGRLDEALVEYREAARLDPEFSAMHYNLGFALLKAGKIQDSEAAFREALRRKPDYAEAHSNLSIALSRQQRFSEAIAELREAVRLQPTYAEAQYNLGNLLAQIGRPREALAHFEIAHAQMPNEANLHFNWGCALLEVNRLKEAVEKFETVLRLNPADQEAARNLGIARQGLSSAK